jgi:hypothetical protein
MKPPFLESASLAAVSVRVDDEDLAVGDLLVDAGIHVHASSLPDQGVGRSSTVVGRGNPS